ncbi:MAG: pH-response regulator protein palA/rim20 [Watsoniomyces obsoletus]|nr:MAG: pH-response regulator protein palA/rim20 [Watsoniomyces obsoletus]
MSLSEKAPRADRPQPDTSEPRLLSLSLVTGANGHLGNNVVRELCSRGEHVRAGVRNPCDSRLISHLVGLSCTPVKIDILDEKLMRHAMEGVDIVYNCAVAPFRMSVKDPRAEIYDVNIEATRVLMRSAKKAKVRRVVFVSSIVALYFDNVPSVEAAGFSGWRWDAYYASKTDSERMAFLLAKDYNLDVVSVLPGTLIGGECLKITEPYRVLWDLYTNNVPIDANAYMNWCHIQDIARGVVQAGFHGLRGQRYILAQQKSTSIRDTVEILHKLYPELEIHTPWRPSKRVMKAIMWVFEKANTIVGKPPKLPAEFVDNLWGRKMDCQPHAARAELNLTLRPVEDVIHDAIEYLEANQKLLGNSKTVKKPKPVKQKKPKQVKKSKPVKISEPVEQSKLMKERTKHQEMTEVKK